MIRPLAGPAMYPPDNWCMLRSGFINEVLIESALPEVALGVVMLARPWRASVYL